VNIVQNYGIIEKNYHVVVKVVYPLHTVYVDGFGIWEEDACEKEWLYQYSICESNRISNPNILFRQLSDTETFNLLLDQAPDDSLINCAKIVAQVVVDYILG
jgi:hypothetical protein